MRKLQGDEAFHAYAAAGLPLKPFTSIQDGKYIVTFTTNPFSAYVTEDGQVQVFQSPHKNEE